MLASASKRACGLAIAAVLGCGRVHYLAPRDAGPRDRELDATPDRGGDAEGGTDGDGDAAPDAPPDSPDARTDVDCPPVAETCNGVDDDCDGEVDEGGDALCLAEERCDGRCVATPMRWGLTLGGAAAEEVWGVVLLPGGDLVITGAFPGTAEGVDFGGGARVSAGARDVFVASYGADGAFRWDHAFGGPLADVGLRVCADGSGNSFVVGYFSGTVDLGGGARTGPGGNDDAFVVSYDADGAYRWDRHLGGGGDDRAYACAADASGGVIVAGEFHNTVDFGGGVRTAANLDIFVVAIDAGGAYVWDRTYGSPSVDASYGVAVDGGAIYVTGLVSGRVDFGGGLRPHGGGWDVFLLALDADGEHLWDHVFDAGSSETGTGVTARAGAGAVLTAYFHGEIDVGGGSHVSAGNEDVLVAEFDRAGGFVWDHIAGGAGQDSPRPPALLPDGRIAVPGSFSGSVDFGGGIVTTTDVGMDGFALLLGSGGTFDRVEHLGGPGAQRATAVTSDLAGRLVVVGTFDTEIDLGDGVRASAGSSDVFVLRLE